MPGPSRPWFERARLELSRALLAIVLATAIGPAVAAGVGPGQPAPDFALPGLDRDGRVELSGYRGHPVLVDFWASWCGPCHQSLPRYAELQREFAARGFNVVAISVDESRDNAREFIDRLGIDLVWAWDGDGQTAAHYGLLGMPSAYLVDGHGVVRHRLLGFKPHDGEALRARIIDLLAENPDAK